MHDPNRERRRPRGRHWAATALVALSLTAARPALSEPRALVVIEAQGSSKAESDVANRIAAELENVGFEVTRPAPGQARGGALATISLTAVDGRVEADVHVPSSHSAERDRHIDARDIQLGGVPAAVALRTVETLRATLFELSRGADAEGSLPENVAAWARAQDPAMALTEPNAQASAPKLAPSAELPDASSDRSPSGFVLLEGRAGPVEPAPSAEYERRVWLGGGLAYLASFAALGLSFGPRLTFSVDLPLGFDVGGSVAGTAPAYDVDAGAYQLVALVEASYSIGKRTWLVSPHANLGLGAHVYVASEAVSASPTTKPGIQRGLAFALDPGVGAAFALTSAVRLDVDVAALFVLPEPVISSQSDDPLGSSDVAREPLISTSIDLVFGI